MSTAVAEIRLAAMNLLARREHSAKELNNKLLRRFDDQASLEQVLASLQQEGLLSDERFVESFVRNRAGNNFGPERIRQELIGKGVDSSLADQYLAHSDDFWLGILQRLYMKKYKTVIANDPAELAKRLRFMRYRGFSHTQIDSFLKSQEQV